MLSNLTQEHDDRIRQIHIIKKQEIEAAVNAFSHAKSFQGLLEEVKSSTKEVIKRFFFSVLLLIASLIVT